MAHVLCYQCPLCRQTAMGMALAHWRNFWHWKCCKKTYTAKKYIYIEICGDIYSLAFQIWLAYLKLIYMAQRPANTRRWHDVGLMLGQRQWLWTSINPALWVNVCIDKTLGKLRHNFALHNALPLYGKTQGENKNTWNTGSCPTQIMKLENYYFQGKIYHHIDSKNYWHGYCGVVIPVFNKSDRGHCVCKIAGRIPIHGRSLSFWEGSSARYDFRLTEYVLVLLPHHPAIIINGTPNHGQSVLMIAR